MERIRKFLRNHFGFKTLEINGFIGLIFGMCIFLFVNSTSKVNLFFDNSNNDYVLEDRQLIEEMIPLLAQKAQAKSQNKNWNKETEIKNIQLFAFNPNEADLETWQKLGVKKYLAERIIKYVSKGGKFKSKEDLLKIYGFPEKIYQQLEAFIVLEENKNTGDKSTQLTDNQQDKSKINSYRQVEVQKFDINEADTSTLKQINGIGSYFAKKIVELRDKLGGFSKLEQAKEVWNLKPETFDKLAQYSFVDTNFEVKKININTATQDELKNHPYISYKLANTIVNYRKQHGKYKKVDDLNKIHSINASLLEKIRSYLKVE